MNFIEFKSAILIAMQKKYPNQSVSIQQVEKNNEVIYDALVIHEYTNKCTPTIYLNDFYKDFCKGLALSEILDSINSFYQSQKEASVFDISFFRSFEQVKDKIVYKLINYSKNKNLLDKIPHIRYLDLAIIFYCLVPSDSFSKASILIRKNHLTFWQTNKSLLFEYAKKNTPIHFPYEVKKIFDVLKDEAPSQSLNPIYKEDQMQAIPMYVLTNLSKVNGASCLLYDNILLKISKQLKSDYYIIPSSVHEIILIPAQNNSRYQELSDMVSSINATQLACEEILSDHVYYYSRRTNSINM